jgi:hypothetical protein
MALEFELIDTFPAFLNYWEASRNDSLECRIKRWETDYLSPWPELRIKQIEEYRRDNVDWHSVARHRIFPRLKTRLPAMSKIHDNLVAGVGPTFRKAAVMFDIPFEPSFVIHVGIGIGAGWGTRFGGRRAILFGLESAAEMDWTDRQAVEALIAHELGHLAHQEWRARAKLAERPERDGPYWRLYEEGFATCFEQDVTGRVHWPKESGWLGWCRQNRTWLASVFLNAVRRRRSVRRFFASWYRIRGHIECGYFLGHETIKEWKHMEALREIAILSEEEVRRRTRRSLLEMAHHVK